MNIMSDLSLIAPVMMLSITILLARVCNASSFSSRPDLVAKVASGELVEAHATWWGFDEDDSTVF